ncbi:MAG: thymidylate synthase [Nanoarchaeota archaeon]|nr:thymidylate synthase [Nanoarchaeota archaeon]
MEQYHEYLKHVLGRGGVTLNERTGEHTIGISSHAYTSDLRQEFPLVTTKNVPPRLPFEELFWKLRGERNVKSLVDRNVPIWTANAFEGYLKRNQIIHLEKHTQDWNEGLADYAEKIALKPEFAEKEGDLGPVYGYQWRHWRKPVFVQGSFQGNRWTPDAWKVKEVDQLENLLRDIRQKPGSRYHILNSYNVGEKEDMALPPCPFHHQFTVYGDNLDLTMIQRSCDSFLGVPFNDAQDGLLLRMVAQETGLQPRFFHHHFINAHIYLGIPPRANFWTDPKNVVEFQRKFNRVKERPEYMELKDWYLVNSPRESERNKRKDHIPFVLEQLSKEPKKSPVVTLVNIPMMEAIQLPVGDVVKVEEYHPHKWDSKAEMAA